MRRVFGFICLILAIIPCASFAETQVKVSGQVRFRAEMDKRSFDTLAATITPSFGRVRLGVEAVVDSNVRAFVQIQDSRTFGSLRVDGQTTSGTTADARNIDLHQGYLELPHLLGQRIGLKLGRFEVAWNNERLMGTEDWDNVGRAWEGGEAWYRGNDFGLDVYVLDAQRRFETLQEASLFVVGVQASLKPYRTNLFLIDDWRLIQYNHCFYSESRSTAGLYTIQSFRSFEVELTGAYQWGTVPIGLPAAAPGFDVSAFMFQSELGYNLAFASKPYLAAGIDYSSGDRNPRDRKNKAFDHLYYTSHGFRGYMGYFSSTYSTNYAGLVDLYARTRAQPTHGWTAGADFHYFHTAATLSDSALSPELRNLGTLGWELDLVASTTRVRGAVLDAGFSIFNPTEAFANFAGRFANIFSGAGTHDLGYWGYFMATVNF